MTTQAMAAMGAFAGAYGGLTHHHQRLPKKAAPCRKQGLRLACSGQPPSAAVERSDDASGAVASVDRREAIVLGTLATLAPPLMPHAALAEPLAAVGPDAVELAGGSKPFNLASFGLQVYDDDTARRLTLTALEVGYRNFFSSVLAYNQKGFAQGVKESGIPREELYICGSVLSNRARGYKAALDLSAKGCAENTKAFRTGGIEYLDMIMLDYPGPDADSIRGQWEALEHMKASGLVNDLAVSNFSPAQLDVVIGTDGSPITVNQLPFSLANRMTGVIKANRDRGILVQSWSPLSRLTNPQLKACGEVGKAHGKSAHQVALRWIIEKGACFTTQSKSKAHFAEDLDVFSWSLTDDEMAYLNKNA